MCSAPSKTRALLCRMRMHLIKKVLVEKEPCSVARPLMPFETASLPMITITFPTLETAQNRQGSPAHPLEISPQYSNAMNCHSQRDVNRKQNKEQLDKSQTHKSAGKFPSITRQTYLQRARKPRRASLKLRWALVYYLREQRLEQDKSLASRPRRRAPQSILTMIISFASRAVILSSSAQPSAVTFQIMTEQFQLLHVLVASVESVVIYTWQTILKRVRQAMSGTHRYFSTNASLTKCAKSPSKTRKRINRRLYTIAKIKNRTFRSSKMMKMVPITCLLIIKKWLTVVHTAILVSHAVLAGTKLISTQAPRAEIPPSQPRSSLSMLQ